MEPENGAALPELLQLWGKTGKGEHAGRFHPALFHMLDVGHVAQVLLGPRAPARMREALARALGCPQEELRDWLPLPVALHDIAKISAAFQGQDATAETRLHRERLQRCGFDFGPRPAKPQWHNLLGAAYLHKNPPPMLSRLPPRLAGLLCDAVNGHHGRFSGSGALRDSCAYLRDQEPRHWNELRHDAAAILQSLLSPRWEQLTLPQEPDCRAATLLLTGFIVLCDWLGSDEYLFPPRDDVGLDVYLEESRRRAQGAAEHAGLLALRRPPHYAGFGALFPGRVANALQRAVDELPLDNLPAPALFIIEAPTGEGKTEAALALARRLAALGSAADEFYFGLPTMATSNQMFGRVEEFVRRLHGSGHGAKLIHGQADLVKDNLPLSPLGDGENADAEATSARAALRWFAPKKRALLAPFGVGTVDQVELTALNTRHYVLRLLGLAGKVVIIDEIHAYDVYMSTILEHALCWYATLGTSVILLSATLPADRHRQLATAFLRGLGTDQALPPPATEPLRYPVLAAYTRAGQVLCNPAAQGERQLLLRFTGEPDPPAIARRLAALVADGGAACYICNTVQAAQDVYTTLREDTPLGTQLLLIHSRFPAEERLALEDRISAAFGPDSKRQPTDRFIVIGTQVLEQSLDIDFDVMISDMAPIDLLLQRAGRLHRHRRQRPPAHQAPRLLVRLAATGDGKPRFEEWTAIYDEYILWWTWLTLQREGVTAGADAVIMLPRAYRQLIEAVYAPQHAGLAPGTPFADLIAGALVKSQREEDNHRGEAKIRLIPDPDAWVSITEGMNTSFDEEEEEGKPGWQVARTRLGEDRLTVVPLYRVGNDLATDPQGRQRVGASLKEDRALQLELLQRSMPVSHKRLVPALRARAAQTPAWFSAAPLLKWVTLLELEPGGTTIGGVPLRLDPELGLVIGDSRKEHRS